VYSPLGAGHRSMGATIAEHAPQNDALALVVVLGVVSPVGVVRCGRRWTNEPTATHPRLCVRFSESPESEANVRQSFVATTPSM